MQSNVKSCLRPHSRQTRPSKSSNISRVFRAHSFCFLATGFAVALFAAEQRTARKGQYGKALMTQEPKYDFQSKRRTNKDAEDAPSNRNGVSHILP